MSGAHPAVALLARAELAAFTGEVLSIGQNCVEAAGPLCSVGEFCIIAAPGEDVTAQVIAVSERAVRLLPLGTVDGIRLGARVQRSAALSGFAAGDGFAGRAVDAFGRPIDGGGPIVTGTGEARARPGKLDRTIVRERVATASAPSMA